MLDVAAEGAVDCFFVCLSCRVSISTCSIALARVHWGWHSSYLNAMLDFKRSIGNQHQHTHVVERLLQTFWMVIVGLPDRRAMATQIRQLVRVSRDEEQLAGGDEMEEVVDDAGG